MQSQKEAVGRQFIPTLKLCTSKLKMDYFGSVNADNPVTQLNHWATGFPSPLYYSFSYSNTEFSRENNVS